MARAKRPALSNSLAELVGEASTTAAPMQATERVSELAVHQLDPNPYQPRREFDREALEQLALSIHTHGVLQPLLVRPVGDRYQIVGGERRWRAAQLLTNAEAPLVVDGQELRWDADTQRLPVVIREVPDGEMRVLAAVENLQRADLNIIDEVDATVSLIAMTLGIPETEVSATLARLARTPDETQVAPLEALFQQLGRGTWQSFLKNKLRVRRLPNDVLTAMRQQGLDYRKATLIGSCTDAHQRAALLTLAAGGASLEQLSTELKRHGEPPAPLPQHTVTLSRSVGRRLTSQAAVAALSAQRQKRLERLVTQLHALFEEQEQEQISKKAGKTRG